LGSYFDASGNEAEEEEKQFNQYAGRSCKVYGKKGGDHGGQAVTPFTVAK
jgi:hypothetical protein